MPFVKGRSGNPTGRPRRGTSIVDLLEQRLDKVAFVNKLIYLSSSNDVPAIIQLSAAKLIWGYIDGLPNWRDERGQGPLEVTVTYVDELNDGPDGGDAVAVRHPRQLAQASLPDQDQ